MSFLIGLKSTPPFFAFALVAAFRAGRAGVLARFVGDDLRVAALRKQVGLPQYQKK